MTSAYFTVCTCKTHGPDECCVHGCKALVVRRDGIYGPCLEARPCPAHDKADVAKKVAQL